MQERDTQHKTTRVSQVPPLVSAADTAEANFPRVRFDEGIAWSIKETARRRAPTRNSIWSHQIGFAGELATAAYFEVEANWSISEGFVGDDGYDLKYDNRKLEVKTVTDENNISLSVSEEQVEEADYFILAKCSTPTELVQLVGYTPRCRLIQHGYKFGEDSLIHFDPEQLYPLEPVFIPPERVRETQSL